MSISTPLNAAPYFDDQDDTKDYYKVLFRPGRAVQTREMNSLQTLLQKQIERFGDNIFKSGTIIDGCNMTTHDELPYLKIRDFQTDGLSVDAESYKGLYIRNSANLVAYIVEAINGFEASSPDLNTLYLKYINSSNSQNAASFAANQQLTIYDPDSPIFSVYVANGSQGFSNSDSVIITNAIKITNSIGGLGFANGFYVGDYITNGLGANVQITEIHSSNTETVLKYKPIANNLVSGNAATWRIEANNAIINSNTAEHAVVVSEVGSGLSLSLRTDTVGKITRVDVEREGTGYTTAPYLSVYSTTANLAQVVSANLVPYNYKAVVTVANNSYAPVGFGYGLSITEGVVYQKGYFLRVPQQLAIVSKYDQPNDLVVGFATTEETVDSNDDLSLLDNSTGSASGAPGADRLKLTPYLSILSSTEAAANSDFLVLMEFKNGSPYKQITQTQYDVIEDNLAKRTLDTSGNFTIDQFLPTTLSPTDFANEANTFEVVVDTGTAYINGYRVSTAEKYIGDSPKGLYTKTNSGSISTNYGAYIRVQNMGGNLPFVNEIYELRSAASTWNGSGAITSPGGSVLGTARIRSIVAEDDFAGIYRLYLYDIKTQPLLSISGNKDAFGSIRSIYYNNADPGVANLILENGQAVLKDSNENGLIYPIGLDAVMSVSNVSYTYRNNLLNATVNSTGYVTRVLSPAERFPQVGALSTADELSLIVIPTANMTSTSNVAGSVTTSTSSAVVTGTGTTFTSLTPGDWVYVANATTSTTAKILSISNNTSLTLTSNAAVAISSANLALYYPKGNPINLQATSRTANVSTDGSTLTISLGHGVNSANVNIVADIVATNIAASAKTVNRDCFVRIDTANNTSISFWGAYGFPLGLTDVIRLKKVWMGPTGNNTFFANQATDVTENFYVDNNQTVDFLNTSYLMKKPGDWYPPAPANFLVQVDCLTATDGPCWVDSYPIDDSRTLSNSAATINTMEIPELYGNKGEYYDLRDCIDFRPRALNTATITSNTSAATINPPEKDYNTRYSANAKKFPNPNKSVSLTATYYNGRKDTVVIDEVGTISIMHGDPNGPQPIKPVNSILIDKLTVPPYPSIPQQLSASYAEIIDTKMASEKYTTERYNKYKISSTLTASDVLSEQPKGYTMADIGNLERRISDLEYYVSFTLQEAYAKDKSIPSQANSAIDRFKFGYFVDPFDDGTYSDSTNPAFKAEFIDSKLVPPHDRVNILLKPSIEGLLAKKRIVAPFSEIAIVSQPYATSTVAMTALNVTHTQKTTSQLVKNQTKLLNAQGQESEVTEYLMSSFPGTIELYYNVRDNRMAIEIWQGGDTQYYGTSPIFTSASAQALTQQDQLTKAANLGPLEPFSAPIYTGTPSKPAILNSGKLLFNHDPSRGRYYKIIVTKYYAPSYVGWSGEYAYNIIYPVDTTDVINPPSSVTVINNGNGTTVSNTSSPVTNFKYNGTIVPDKLILTATNVYQPGLALSLSKVTTGDVVQLTVTGLKPNTLHTFTVSGKDQSAYCRPTGRNVGTPLLSDANGKMVFQWFYDAYAGATVSSFVYSVVQQTSVLQSSIDMVLSNDDGSSIAKNMMGLNTYYGYQPTPATSLPSSPKISLSGGSGLADKINGARMQNK